MHNLTISLLSIIVCVDETALHRNIPIERGITTVHNVPTATKRFTIHHQSLLMSPLRCVTAVHSKTTCKYRYEVVATIYKHEYQKGL
jgi:hypothetical protein